MRLWGVHSPRSANSCGVRRKPATFWAKSLAAKNAFQKPAILFARRSICAGASVIQKRKRPNACCQTCPSSEWFPSASQERGLGQGTNRGNHPIPRLGLGAHIQKAHSLRERPIHCTKGPFIARKAHSLHERPIRCISARFIAFDPHSLHIAGFAARGGGCAVP